MANPDIRTETHVLPFEEVSLRTGLGLRTLRALASAGQIEVVQLSRRRVGITEAALLRFIELRTRAAPRS